MIVEVFKSLGRNNQRSFYDVLSSFSKTLNERAISTNRDDVKCLHRVHLTTYVDDSLFGRMT